MIGELYCEVRKSRGPQVRPLHIADSAQIFSAVEVCYSKEATGTGRVLSAPLTIVILVKLASPINPVSRATSKGPPTPCYHRGTMQHCEGQRDSNRMQAKN